MWLWCQSNDDSHRIVCVNCTLFSAFGAGLGRAFDRESKVLQDPLILIREKSQQLDECTRRLKSELEKSLQLAAERFKSALGRLEALSPLGCLSRGYSITFDAATSKILKSTRGLSLGQKIRTRMAHGSIQSRIEDIQNDTD